MLIVLADVSEKLKQRLGPFLTSRLKFRWFSVPDYLHGRARLERLYQEVMAAEESPMHHVVLDGWWWVRAAASPAFQIRALALDRLLLRSGGVLLHQDQKLPLSFTWEEVWAPNFVRIPATHVLYDLVDSALAARREPLAVPVRAGVGDPQAGVVIVGERPSRFAWHGLPFSGGRAAGLLRQALRGRPPVYLLNASYPTVESAVQELRLLAAHRPKFLALGRLAEAWLHRQGLACACLPHPAHVVRFQRDGIPQWVDQVREVIAVGRQP